MRLKFRVGAADPLYVRDSALRQMTARDDFFTGFESSHPTSPVTTFAPSAAQPRTRRIRIRRLDVFGIVAVLLVVLLVSVISFSNGVDHIHGFGRTCLVVHDGWHFSVQCARVAGSGHR